MIRRIKKKTLIGTVLFSAIALTAIAAPLIAKQNPNAMSLANRFQSPSAAHLFGLDQNGADVFAQIVFGARTSLTIAFTVVVISTLLGLIIGSWAGFKGGFWDLAINRVLDMIQAFPGLLLALALVAVLGPSFTNLIIALSMTGWAGYARLVRGEVLYLKEREYVKGAEASGANTSRILIFHIWPNLAGLLAVQATFGLAGVIMAESGLSFLGVGVPPETPTWGAVLSNGRRFLSEAPHISLFPGLAIALLVLSIQLLGESLRGRLSPRERSGAMRSSKPLL